MIVVKTSFLPPGAVAFTFWPWVFVRPSAAGDATVLLHESVHLEQQRRWALWGLVIPGLLAWYALYLLALPVGWNWWRARWERTAMKAEGRSHAEITATLRKAPYYLWWMS